MYNDLGEPLRQLRCLASGYPLHHLRGLRPLGGSASIPLAKNALKIEKAPANGGGFFFGIG